jgi:hypothetical protein
MEAIGVEDIHDGETNRYQSIAQQIFAALSDSGPEKSEGIYFLTLY